MKLLAGFLTFLILNVKPAFAVNLVDGKLSWQKMERLEKKMLNWSKKVGTKDMLAMGKMKQRPDEIEVIRAYFPYLLPKGFFSFSQDMSCYPDFDKFRRKPNAKHYDAWSSCLRLLYRQSMPELHKKALSDLKP